MIYNVFLREIDDDTIIRSYFNEILDSLATFEFYTSSTNLTEYITVFYRTDSPNDTVDDWGICVEVGDTKKKIINKILRLVLYQQGYDVDSVLYNTRFNDWFRNTYEKEYYSILQNECNGLDSEHLFTQSADFMEVFYKYLGDYEIYPEFGSQVIYFKSDIPNGKTTMLTVRTGEEKNVILSSYIMGAISVLGVYSFSIESGVEYTYNLTINKDNNIDVIGFDVNAIPVFSNYHLDYSFADVEGLISIGGIGGKTEFTAIDIVPLTYYYDNFSDFATVDCENEDVNELAERYFKYTDGDATFTKMNGTLNINGNAAIFIKSYKYREMIAKFVVTGSDSRIYFMKQVANTDVSVFNSNCVNFAFNEFDTTVVYHRYIGGVDTIVASSANGLFYPSGATYTLTVTILTGTLTVKIGDDTVLTCACNDITPGAYDYGYVGFVNTDSESTIVVESIEINGDEKFGRGLQIGRYIDDFDYNSNHEYNGGR